uniref:Molybdopterin biosynthesis protein n=1 Tax=Liagoropsis maxima TaxID=1653392 RepID=A0A1G4NW18_9FLOR|nr:Molybdopterin biosynthesis protein [Liagoropsis maxima]SCW22862.1 Molybdopterin biosynthesis protein [Liagoropsis maxima]
MHEDQWILNSTEYQLYARHLMIPEIRVAGQKRLKKARVLFIGAGGLSSSSLLYLTAAGIGHIGIIDHDTVELSNLQRQVIYNINQIGNLKTICAQQTLNKLNPNCKLQIYNQRFSQSNAHTLIKSYDIIIDGTDNFNTRHIISTTCYKLHKIHIYGAISSFEGQVSVFNYSGGPHYNDIKPISINNTMNDCNIYGVLGVLPGLIGLIQATEALKIIIGIGNILSGYMIIYNALQMSFKKIKIRNKTTNVENQPNKYYPQQNTINSKLAYENLSINFLHKYLKNYKNITYLVDIRSSNEYESQHLQYAINIPLNKLQDQNNLKILKKQAKNKNIIIYCNSYSRSKIASVLLTHADIEHYILKI